MAIRPYSTADESNGIEPLCALKVGSFNCFCMWSSDTNTELQSAALVDVPAPPPAARQAPVEDSADSGADIAAEQLSRDGLTIATDHPLLNLVRLHLGAEPAGRSLAALKDLGKFSGDMRNLDAVVMDQVRRVAAQYEEVLELPEASPAEWAERGWTYESFQEWDLVCGARVVDGLVEWFRTFEVTGDIVKGFAAHMEADLAASHFEDLVTGEPLGMHTAKRDAVWRIVTQGPKFKHDNIWLYSGLDALEEPPGSLIIFACTTLRPPGLLSVPAPMSGAVRSDFASVIFRFQPLYENRFRFTQLGINRDPYSVPPSAPSTNGAVPLPPQVRDIARLTRSYYDRFCRCMDNPGRLDQRMSMSPRTELYARVRRHMAHVSKGMDSRRGPPPPPSSNPSMGELLPA